VYAFLADRRQRLFPPELFIDVARQGGWHPLVPAEVIGPAMVLQALEGLSDRRRPARCGAISPGRWPAGYGWTMRGFIPVLVYWRNRLRSSDRPRRILDAVRQVVEETRVLKGRSRRVLDSTILADAVATRTPSPSWWQRSAESVG
jgi:hypothetical protein